MAVNLNDLGALTLVVSGATVIFAMYMAVLGLSIRHVRNVIRLLIVELFDEALGRKGKNRISVKIYRAVISVFVPFRRRFLALSGMKTQAMAVQLSKQALIVNTGLVSLAFFILLLLLGFTDLSNRYVVMNSASGLGLFYRLTGVWAGSSGSLLFWYFLLTLFSAIAIVQTKDRLFNRVPVFFLIIGSLQLLFVFLAMFFRDAQPFREFAVEMVAGQGINPLLLHWAMIIHPPMLYFGYVSFAIPFAIVASGAVTGNLKDDFLPFLRRWSLFSWFFLGFGILLGGKWAYEELGWGGYWAWDPVENSSLMPFLFATAFLHSLIVQERRGMLKFWNFLLITLTYHFCLLGTWITRSGVLEGPHSFAESSIGSPMILYITGSFLYFGRFLYFRRHQLKSRTKLEAITSKEGSMLLNNFLMTFSVLIILIGVFSPLIPLECGFGSEGFTCHKVEWKLTTFNKLMVPVGVVTLFLMGASPLLAWRKGADTIYAKTLRTPLIAGILGSVIFALVYGFLFTRALGADHSAWGPGIVAEVFSILTVGIAVFNLVGLFQEFQRGVKSRRIRFGENVLQGFVKLILRNKRRYGGYLVHISVVFLFLGYAGGAFKKTEKFSFFYQKMPAENGSEYVRYYSGDKAYLDSYTIEARDLFIRPEFQPNADKTKPIEMAVVHEAHYRVNPPGLQSPVPPDGQDPFAFANRPTPASNQFIKFVSGFILDGRMKTERHFYPRLNPATGRLAKDASGATSRIPTSKPDIKSAWSEDFYIQLGSIYDPTAGQNPDLVQMFEFYYYDTGRHPVAYEQLFPQQITATLEVWVNPLVKFVWLGTILFFISGLIVLIPFGERK